MELIMAAEMDDQTRKQLGLSTNLGGMDFATPTEERANAAFVTTWDGVKLKAEETARKLGLPWKTSEAERQAEEARTSLRRFGVHVRDGEPSLTVGAKKELRRRPMDKGRAHWRRPLATPKRRNERRCRRSAQLWAHPKSSTPHKSNQATCGNE